MDTFFESVDENGEGKYAEIQWFDEPGHVILVGNGADRVMETMGDFCLEKFHSLGMVLDIITT